MTSTTAATTTRRRLPRLPGGVSVLLLLLFVFLSVAGPTIWGHAAEATRVVDANQGLSSRHLLGTDDLGRDLFARTLVATRQSLVLAVLATVVGGVVGIALGLVSGVSRRIGRFVGSVINLLIAFPALLLAIFFAVLFGIGSVGSVLAVGAAFAPGFARITQTLTASAVSRDYVEASRVMGRGNLYIVGRHILPNIAEPVILYSTIHIGTAILSLSGLSFLGLGVQPPSYDWGRLLSDGLTRVYISPGAALGPAVAIVLAGLTFNMVGERISDVIGGRGKRLRRRRGELAALPAAREGAAPDDVVLDVQHLQVVYTDPDGRVTTPVRDVSFSVVRGETIGIVGESGSGKSMATSAIAQLVELPGTVRASALRFQDVDLLDHSAANDAVLGRTMSMVFQDPGEALNPAIKVGTHLIEPAVVHLHDDKPTARRKAIEAMRSVAVSDPERRYRQHQHELSGGMKQRICIAIGLMGEPQLLIADEPTTALDVTVQRQILRLIAQIGADTGASILFISHDVAVVSEICDRILVMYAGFVVEQATKDALLSTPAHPYTQLLLAASPHMGTAKDEPLTTLEGRMPGADAELPGCYFAARCPRADSTCVEVRPPLTDVGDGHLAACWHPLTGDAPNHGALDVPAGARS